LTFASVSGPAAPPAFPYARRLAVIPVGDPFGGMGKPVNQNGFSDHFPITMTVTELD
jgi:hypothetical protein